MDHAEYAYPDDILRIQRAAAYRRWLRLNPETAWQRAQREMREDETFATVLTIINAARPEGD